MILWTDPLHALPVQTLHATGLLAVFAWTMASVPRSERWLVGPVCLGGVAAAALGGRAAWLLGQWLGGQGVLPVQWWHPTAGGYASLGLVAGGGVWLAVLACAWRGDGAKVRGWLDALVPAGALGLGLARLGCLVRGCDVGAALEQGRGLLGVRYLRVAPEVADLGAHHPFALYLSAATIVWTLGVCAVVPRGRAQRALGVGAGYLCIRAALEPWRHASHTPTLAGWSLHSLMALAGLALTGLAIAAWIQYGGGLQVLCSREVERATTDHDDGR